MMLQCFLATTWHLHGGLPASSHLTMMPLSCGICKHMLLAWHCKQMQELQYRWFALLMATAEGRNVQANSCARSRCLSRDQPAVHLAAKIWISCSSPPWLRKEERSGEKEACMWQSRVRRVSAAHIVQGFHLMVSNSHDLGTGGVISLFGLHLLAAGDSLVTNLRKIFDAPCQLLQWTSESLLVRTRQC